MDQHSVPAAHVLYLVELVQRWHVSAEDLLSGSGVAIATISDPKARVSVPEIVKIIARARSLTGEPALGFHLGLQMRVSRHGYLGFAALSASTMREGIELSARYAPIVSTAIGLRLRIDGREASVIFEEHADFGTARDFVLFSLLVGFWRIGEAATGREMRDGYFDFAFPEPSYRSRLGLFAEHVRFGQPVNRLLFDARLLDLPYRMADPIAVRLAKEQCERELNSLGLDGRLVGRVRDLVSRNKEGFLSLAQVASALHLSPRTLKRQLAAEGVSFSEIVEEERRQSALLLLRAPELSIEQVAARLGYSNVANFARAFRRWTGSTPADYRRTGIAQRLSD
jgi:AraC-like DNA-binding protein